MNSARLDQYLAEKNYEINRGAFSEIPEADDEGKTSGFTSKASTQRVS
jgi:hypothetical protein